MRTLEQLAEDAYQIYRANAGVAARPWSELPPAARAAWLASITFAVIEAKRDRVSAPPGMVKAEVEAIKPIVPDPLPGFTPLPAPAPTPWQWRCGCNEQGPCGGHSPKPSKPVKPPKPPRPLRPGDDPPPGYFWVGSSAGLVLMTQAEIDRQPAPPPGPPLRPGTDDY